MGRFTGYNKFQFIIWLAAIAAFLVHRYLQYFLHINIRFLNNYLDPFLLPLILLPLMIVEMRLLLADRTFTFPFIVIVACMVVIALATELVFPAVSKNFVADAGDCVAIALSSILAHFLFNK